MGYSYYYPLFMAYLWITGAMFYYWRFERPDKGQRERTAAAARASAGLHRGALPQRRCRSSTRRSNTCSPAAIRISKSCWSTTAAPTKRARCWMRSPRRDPKVRVIHLAHNQGKAVALTTAALMTSAEYLACIDADALLDPDARHLDDEPPARQPARRRRSPAIRACATARRCSDACSWANTPRSSASSSARSAPTAASSPSPAWWRASARRRCTTSATGARTCSPRTST